MAKQPTGKKRINFYVPEKHLEIAAQMARHRGITVSELLRWCILQGLRIAANEDRVTNPSNE